MLDQTEPVRQEPVGTIDAQLAACPAAVTTPEFRVSTMTRKRDQVSHLVQVARFRIETVVIEIRGDDIGDDEAAIEAVEIAEQLPQRAWVRQPYDADSYRPHVQAMISREEIAELREMGNTASAESLLDPEDDIRYVLLKADCGNAEGEVVLQPWLDVDQPNLLTSDLCREWLKSLENLGLTHMSERLDELAAGSPPLPSDQVLFNVKKPRKPGT